jgi:hypothetical protein
MSTIAGGCEWCSTEYVPCNHAKELSGMTPLQSRIQLQRLFNPREGRKLNVRDDFPLQLAGLAALEGQHTIRVVADPPDLSENYNCVAHALGLRLVEEYRDCFKRNRRSQAHPMFFTWLVEQGKLEPVEEAEWAIIAYFVNDKCAHAGLMLAGGRVVSKWGIGHLFEHGKDEVPLNYGDDIRFYRKPAPNESWKWICEFRDTHGSSF